MITDRYRSKWVHFVVITILVIGIFFRLFNIDKKLYWMDETYTSLRISGHTEAELIQEFYGGNTIISIQNLHKFRYPNPEKSLGDTIKSLALEDPQHPPLYYVMTRLWVQWFGNSVTVTRSLSACFSLLLFPCIYWLCRELFNSSLVGWIAIALTAISPFHVLYAQEARPYSLWTVMIVLSSTALLRARRLKTNSSWGIYAVTVALGLYTSLFSGLVTVAHAIYILVIESFRFSKTVIAYLIATLIGLLAFTPWLFVVINSVIQIQSTTQSLSKATSLFTLLKRWVASLSVIFIDVGLETTAPLTQTLPVIPFIALLLILAGYSLYFLCRNTPKQVWFFILTLFGVTAITLTLPDFILGGRTSSTPRFLIPCYLAIQIAVAHLFATQINSMTVTIKQQKLWRFVMAGVISSGVLSCALSTQAEMWWNKAPSLDKYTPQAARIVNQSIDPLLLSDAAINVLTPLTYRLNPNVHLQWNPYCYTSCRKYRNRRNNKSLVVNQNLSKFPNNFKNVFLFKPSKALLARFEKKYQIEPVYKESQLWQLEKKIN